MSDLLFTTVIGSHLWMENREESDVDLFSVVLGDSKKILLGEENIGKSRRIVTGRVDLVEHELGKVLKMLEKGNVNFYIGVKSPYLIYGIKTAHEDIGNIAESLLSKRIYPSINGIARALEKKESRQSLIERVIGLGIGVLKYGEVRFEPSREGEFEDKIAALEKAYEESMLPEWPAKESIKRAKDFLLLTRLMNLENKVKEPEPFEKGLMRIE